jgi:alpha-D-ribose 1-methylphosphonate 5-triphosphate synthase subunit PhnH
MNDAVHLTQATYRVLLDALAGPGVPRALPSWDADVPATLGSALALACLTLLDADVAVWEQPGAFDDPARAWLAFHTGTRRCENGREADFALLREPEAFDVHGFAAGTPEEPERSTTLLIKLPRLGGGGPVALRGPGIAESVTCAPPLPPAFWHAWEMNGRAYPCGIDVFLFDDAAVIGLPRTVAAEAVR